MGHVADLMQERKGMNSVSKFKAKLKKKECMLSILTKFSKQLHVNQSLTMYQAQC